MRLSMLMTGFIILMILGSVVSNDTAPLSDVEHLYASSQDAYYVSRAGDNTDGLSWATAWNELDQINWEVIGPGDVIYLDGGVEQMVYETALDIRQSGQAELPITIQVSDEESRSGQVIFFGGRDNPLPYCGQQDYNNVDQDQLSDYGIRTHDHDYIQIDGRTWSGIVIHGYKISGIRIDRDSDTITIRNVEIYNNGEAEQEQDGWIPDHAGVRIAGRDITFQRAIVHDNGQDAFQSLPGKNNLQNFRLEQSWLYNGREHPSVPGKSANYCTHTDGIQIYDGGVVRGITLIESIIGPGFTQGVILGQTETDGGSWADVHDVTLRDVVFTKATDNAIMAYRDTDPENWVLDHVTAYCPNTDSHCLLIANDSHHVTNSVIVDGLVTLPDGLKTFEDNCLWKVRGFDLGPETDPGFADVSANDSFSLDDYSVDPDSNCQGSRTASVEQLLSLK
ncbi:MAG: hypothetical protein L0154_28085 [Chloroflexi bacterium]|nr:hypothetical protein [Chloroflexota bacterium]